MKGVDSANNANDMVSRFRFPDHTTGSNYPGVLSESCEYESYLSLHR